MAGEYPGVAVDQTEIKGAADAVGHFRIIDCSAVAELQDKIGNLDNPRKISGIVEIGGVVGTVRVESLSKTHTLGDDNPTEPILTNK